MICLVACVIYFGNVGYHDTCSAKVEVVYSTKDNHYVKVMEADGGNTDVKVSINIWRQVNKKLCRKQK